MLDAGKCKSGRRHQARARDQQRPQIMARRDPACDQGQQRRSEQRCGRDNADRDGVVTERRHVGRQNDDGKTVAEAAQAPRDIEQRDQRVSGGGFRFGRDTGHAVGVHAQSSTRRVCAELGRRGRLTGSLLHPRYDKLGPNPAIRKHPCVGWVERSETHQFRCQSMGIAALYPSYGIARDPVDIRGRAVNSAHGGFAISPRGDMPKYRVPFSLTRAQPCHPTPRYLQTNLPG